MGVCVCACVILLMIVFFVFLLVVFGNFGVKYHVFDCLGVPPLVSRRILETLTYLARNHPYVAKILLQFKLPVPPVQELQNLDKSRGKAVMILDDNDAERKQHVEGQVSLALLLTLLNLPLYFRSIAHLEQVRFLP